MTDQIFNFPSNIRKIRSKNVTTYATELTSCCLLEVEAGTNGYYAGDSDSITYIRLTDRGGTCITVRTLGDYFYYPEPHISGFKGGAEIILVGGCELEAIKAALKFMLLAIEAAEARARSKELT